MNGQELKKRIQEAGLRSAHVAREIGVTPQSMSAYFGASDLRQETIDRIDTAIRQLTAGRCSLYDVKEEEHPHAPTPDAYITELLKAKDETITILKEQLEAKDRQIRALREDFTQFQKLLRPTLKYTDYSEAQSGIAADKNEIT